MTGRHPARIALLAPLVVSGLALTGCVSSPTYGTDKTASAQLADDIGNAFSFAPKRKDRIDYKPRAALVKPAPGQRETLPAPQDSITQTASNQWPESPEQRRKRLRDEATAHQGDPTYQAQIVDDVQVDQAAWKQALAESRSDHPPPPGNMLGNSAARRAEIARRTAEGKQGDPTSRKYLSEPPLSYRVSASTAPQGELGEDEYKKERRLKAEATKSKGLFDWLPW
ncbi:MAG: hypothetical protein WA973_12295 [Mesorhizobium sp.]|jgi:hypothetical protein|uniref:Lipoprotein n=1 Tax=Aquamicrobium soli TaxID=1811518 RepID=A0ABV7K4U2_9HYPH